MSNSSNLDSGSSSSKRDLINSTVLATPCPAKWGEMSGDKKQRFCAECKLHVYNISEMTEAEASALLEENRGANGVCLRFFRRADGTVLLKNCPVGLKQLRDRARQAAAWLAAGLSCLLSLAANAKAGDAAADCDKGNKKPLFHGSIKTQQANNNGDAAAAATTPSTVRGGGEWLTGKPMMSVPTPTELADKQARLNEAVKRLGADNAALVPQLLRLGNDFRLVGNHKQSAEYFKRAIAVLEKEPAPRTAVNMQQMRAVLYSYKTLCVVTGDKGTSDQLTKQIQKLDDQIAAERKSTAN